MNFALLGLFFVLLVLFLCVLITKGGDDDTNE